MGQYVADEWNAGVEGLGDPRSVVGMDVGTLTGAAFAVNEGNARWNARGMASANRVRTGLKVAIGKGSVLGLIAGGLMEFGFDSDEGTANDYVLNSGRKP